MTRVVWSRPSTRDLIEIDGYLEQHDKAAAIRMIKAIRSTAALLARFPALGPPLKGDIHYLGVRTTPYVIVYRLHEGRVEVLRIRHERQNWLAERPSE